jgi:hypothetical protein
MRSHEMDLESLLKDAEDHPEPPHQMLEDGD